MVIEVHDLVKTFNGTTAVDRLSFTAQRGEILGLLGPNGAGKTTAIQMILGIIEPTAGSIRVFDQDITTHRQEILQRLNFSSAYVSLPQNLRVMDNLRVFAGLYGVSDWRQKAMELLRLFEIDRLATRKTGQLSSGESTRLHLCKALLNAPELLLLDEPTASLDPDIADKVRKLLRRIQRERGITVLYTSHNMREIEEVCDRVIFLHHGRKMAEGPPRDVIAQFNQQSLEQVFIRIVRDGELQSSDQKSAQ
ncbi:MAG: ABC transporter ATP-binding protein [Verrucomicrobia bacterium]|nr:ABC transporter ATP-binding protein [Verrucomicrobiota bacterium]